MKAFHPTGNSLESSIRQRASIVITQFTCCASQSDSPYRKKSAQITVQVMEKVQPVQNKQVNYSRTLKTPLI